MSVRFPGRTPLAALALAAALAPAILAAQTPTARERMRNRPQVPDSAIQKDAIALSLEQVIEMALRSNLDIALSRYGAQRSANSVIEEDAAFDPVFSGSSTHSERTSPTASELDGAAVLQTENSSFSGTISQQNGIGGTASATTTMNRSSTNSSFSNLDPTYRAGISLSYSQPLLRNFGLDSNKFGFRVARNNRTLSNEGFRNQVMLVIEQAVSSYWDLVAAIEDLAVRERSLELANDLKRQNEIMVEVGTLAPIEITVAEAEVASRLEAIIVARSTLEDAEDSLLSLLNVPHRSELWERPVYPLDLPVFEVVEIDLDEAYRLAFENRPELRQKLMELENARLTVGFNKDQTLPQLDLVFGLEYNGLAGDLFEDQPIDTDGDTIPDDFIRIQTDSTNLSDAYQQVLDRDFDNWSVTLNYSIPIGNRAAKARLANARLDYESRLAEMEQLQDEIRVEVRQGVRNLRSDLERVEAARVTRRLREEQLDAERKKFDEGLATNYQVLQFQRDLEDAQLSETQAIVDYSKAVVEMKRITGNLLQDLGVQLVQPEATIRR